MRQILLLALILSLVGCSCNRVQFVVSGSLDNDLVKILKSNKGLKIDLYDSPMEAVMNASKGEAVLVLADGYPEERIFLTTEFFERIQDKRLRVYVEYPSELPGLALGEPVRQPLERAVVNSSFFGGMPDSLDILVLNGLTYLPVEVEHCHLVAARVAGFDEAVYGLPESVSPLLFGLPGEQILVSTTSLSRIMTGRYAPKERWTGVWRAIFAFLHPGKKIPDFAWQQDVQPFYRRDEKLPEDFQKTGITNGIEWFLRAKMLVPPSYDDTLKAIQNYNLLPWDPDIPEGDGTLGSCEAIMSVINENGGQPIGTVLRGDCIGETAMTFAAAGSVLNNNRYHEISENLLDYYLTQSPAAENDWVDPESSAYGLIPWGITNYAWYRANYGDDNARELMGILVSAALIETTRWEEIVMRCLVAQFRTTGIHGFRGSRIDLPDFAAHDWTFFFNRDIINPAPHFESYLWACFLWAYHQTGYAPFLERTREAIRITMERYPDGWRWTNGLAQEKARMILCLSWLIRVDDTEEHRDWLYAVLDDLLLLQDKCGAIREELGDLAMGVYPPPQSNDSYGTNEASLLGQNGDLVSDLLYTTNFAFLGLHEAAFATGDPEIIRAEEKLAEFLCRIQVNSPKHPEIHGGWFRAFDIGRFEHWGCNADHGWGAWCIESGWTQGWITTVLALREMKTSVWDLTENSGAGNYFEGLASTMLIK